MKACTECHQSKREHEFYTTRGKPNSKCKECTKRRVRARYVSERKKIAAYERERARRPERRALRISYMRALRKRDPVRYAAWNAVNNAVRDGRLQRLPCEVCGEEKTQAHHDDYTKPLEVRWLCFVCHRQHHGQHPIKEAG